MKICFTIASLHCGGAERVVSTISNAFADKGHEVTILLVSTSDTQSFYKLNEKVKVISAFNGHKKTRFFSRVKLINRHILLINPDVVVAFLPHVIIYTYYAIRGLNIPFICSERNDPHQYSKIRQILLKNIFRRASGTIFQTKMAEAYYKKQNCDNSTIIYNPVFLNNHESLHQPYCDKYFISVGRLEKQKRFDILIGAFSKFLQKHQDYSLVIYGDGTLKKELINQCTQLGIQNKVEFPGVNPNWHSVAKKSIAFISTSDYEGMPNCLEEALCLGCNCIATDCPIGGSKELIDLLGTGKLINKDNEIELLNALDQTTKISKNSKIPNYERLMPSNVLLEWEKFIYSIKDKN